jgi:hypothetical protein
VRDREAIDSELRLIAAVRRTSLALGGPGWHMTPPATTYGEGLKRKFAGKISGSSAW